MTKKKPQRKMRCTNCNMGKYEKKKVPDYIKSYEIMLIYNEPKGELDLTQQL